MPLTRRERAEAAALEQAAEAKRVADSPPSLVKLMRLDRKDLLLEIFSFLTHAFTPHEPTEEPIYRQLSIQYDLPRSSAVLRVAIEESGGPDLNSDMQLRGNPERDWQENR